MFPAKLERNIKPIINETIRAGETLVTSDKLIGDKYSSPMVNKSVQKTGQNQLPFSSPIKPAPTTITMKDKPKMVDPIAILPTLVGSLPLRACHAQNMSRRGASIKINNGLKDWNQVAGISQPMITGH